jgi:prephenate dehydrogenase
MITPAVRRVTVIGTGLIGTSLALALRRHAVQVRLSDRDDGSVAQAQLMGAGSALAPEDPPADVVVIATPPSTVPAVLRWAQSTGLGAVYTDVASTKAGVLAGAVRVGCDLASFVPGHPIAGRELSGPAAARDDLFAGRPWVLCPHPETSRVAVSRVTELATLCEGRPSLVAPDVHDRVMALVSHAPHVVAAVLAARFAAPDETTLSLVGKGLQDVTRIAAGSTTLWCDILWQNAEEVAEVLEAIAVDVTAAARALRSLSRDRSGPLADLLDRGNRGRQHIVATQHAALPAEPSVRIRDLRKGA